MITTGNLLNGVKISFETRGVDDETADFLWNQLSPSKIKQFTEETGHNLVVYDKKGEQVAVLIEYGETKYLHQKVYNVRCGKSFNEE